MVVFGYWFWNYLAMLIGGHANSQALAEGNLDALVVSSGENLTWQKVIGIPSISDYFSSGK